MNFRYLDKKSRRTHLKAGQNDAMKPEETTAFHWPCFWTVTQGKKPGGPRMISVVYGPTNSFPIFSPMVRLFSNSWKLQISYSYRLIRGFCGRFRKGSKVLGPQRKNLADR